MASLFLDQRGTATVEYVSLLLLVTIPMAAVLWTVGPGLVQFFQTQMMWLALPFP